MYGTDVCHHIYRNSFSVIEIHTCIIVINRFYTGAQNKICWPKFYQKKLKWICLSFRTLCKSITEELRWPKISTDRMTDRLVNNINLSTNSCVMYNDKIRWIKQTLKSVECFLLIKLCKSRSNVRYKRIRGAIQVYVQGRKESVPLCSSSSMFSSEEHQNY